MKTTALTVTVALAVLSSGVASQVRVVRSGDDRLTGIGQVDVLVTLTPSSMSPCHITPSALQRGALDSLRGAGITATISEKAPSWHYSVVVDVRGHGTDTTCAAAITTELVAHVAGIPDADGNSPPGRWGSLLLGSMPLVRDNDLVMTTPLAHDGAVQHVVQEHVAVIAARIRAANQ